MDEKNLTSFLQSLGVKLENVKSVIHDSGLFDSIKECDPILAAGYFSGLMVSKQYHANNYLLSILVHGCLIIAKGDSDINYGLANSIFKTVGDSLFGQMQDPPEDTFISTVHLFGNSFSLFEGSWEANSFHTQTFLHILESMPRDKQFAELQKSIFSLLTISNELSKRKELRRYESGDEVIHTALLEDFSSIVEVRNPIVFSQSELKELGVEFEELRDFCLQRDEFSTLIQFELGETALERKPLAIIKENLYVLLPDAIGSAIRLCIIEWCFKRRVFRKGLRRLFKKFSLSHCIEEVPGLSDYHHNPYCYEQDNIENSDFIERLINFDTGRYLHQIFIFDDFSDYENKYFNGQSSEMHNMYEKISSSIKNVSSYLQSLADFKDAITLIIICGWGRQVQLEFSDSDLDKWKIEFLTGYDFSMLFGIEKNTAEEFFRFIELKEKSEAAITITNPSGIYNLWSWAIENNRHIISHDEYPLELSYEEFKNSIFVLAPNSYLNQRVKVKQNKDAHYLEDPNGNLVLLERITQDWFFNEDANKPIYASVSHAVHLAELLGLIYVNHQKWWCTAQACENSDRSSIYDLWSCLCNWISRLTRVGYEAFEDLNFTDVSCNFVFDFQRSRNAKYKIPTDTELRSLVACESIIKENKVIINLAISEEYFYGFQQAGNNAERILIEALLKEILLLYYDENKTQDFVDIVIGQLFINNSAKHFHLMLSNRVRHYVEYKQSEPIIISKFDLAIYKVGSIWLSQPFGIGPKIIGKKECCKLIREHTSVLIDILIDMMSGFSKSDLIQKLLLNIDSIGQGLDHWNMTFAAIESLHDDKDSVFKVTSRKISSYQEASISTRILLEISVCHAGQKSNNIPGNIDISRMISIASVILSLCGWSDQIHYEMTPSELHIAPSGDIRLDHTFSDETLNSYGNVLHRAFTNQSKENYISQYIPFEQKEFGPGVLSEEFENAWFSEFGFTIYDGRNIVLKIEKHCINLRSSIVTLTKNEFLKILSGDFSLESISAFLANFSLFARPVWKEFKHEFLTLKEIHPWRFRRRFSFVSRPILQFDEKIVLHADSLVDGFYYFLRSCYGGIFEDRQFASHSMKKWIGQIRNKSGHAFNKQVAEEFIVNGWKAKSDIKLTELLGVSLDKDYGDIDVVAWNEGTGEVLLIECKDLFFAKIPGEIAKQIYDFRGVNRTDGKPDRLKKHLNRISKLVENTALLNKKLGLDGELILKPYLLFRNTVPIQFANHEALKKVQIITFSDIARLKVS
ncbi:MAG: hypothetical protein KJN84_16845 [Bacteroidia bacterium]|nr:hypothetical protein [Bacteroidia bacterium]